MDKLPVGQLPDLASSNNDDEIMVITNSEYSQLKKEKISDFITDFTSTNENNALTKGTDGKLFVTDFGNASNITEGTLPVSVLPDIPKDKLPEIETTDLPASGVAANTYAYPSSVTVNAQGQVTAIEEGTPSGSNANVDLSNITEAGKEVIRENSGGGLEICDIGMALYVDETKGLRRRLNGTILDINTNTQAFLTRLQQITTLYPSLVCTEEEWQAAKTLSAFGQVGKFVYNYGSDGTTVVSVRLPAVVNIQGLQDLQNTGLTVEQNMQGLNIAAGSTTTVAGLPVQQEAIQYPYFIQVATGAETENNIINEIELNNPFFFGMSQYFDVEPNNLSWLKSAGQWNSKAVYPDYYNWILEQVNSGVDGFKGIGYAYSTADSSLSYWITSTIPAVGQTVYGNSPIRAIGKIESLITNGFVFTDDTSTQRTVTRNSVHDAPITDTNWINDYDFVLNTADETFRLPLLDGSEDIIGNEYETISTAITTTKQAFVAKKNGIVYASASSPQANVLMLDVNNVRSVINGSWFNGVCRSGGSVVVKRGDTIAYSTEKNSSTDPAITYVRIFYAQGNGNLYFYVGETVQNANLINAGRIGEVLVDKVDMQQAAKASMPSSKYIDLTLGANRSTYTAPANGWFAVQKVCGVNAGYIYFVNQANNMGIEYTTTNTSYTAKIYIPVKKGDIVEIGYYMTGKTDIFRFIYAEGEN